MALSTVQTNNKLIRFTTEINREFVRTNLWSPYMGEGPTSIIRKRYEPKRGGEQINIPLVTRLTNVAKGVGTLTGSEESIDNYGMRMYIDWARHAVITNKAEKQKDSADIFGEAKPLLSDWGKELVRDEIIEGFMAHPSESAPALLGTDNGGRVNGILYQDATAGQHNTWAVNNSDRVLYGASSGNFSGVHATDLAKIDTVTDKMDEDIVTLAKRLALVSSPAIRPYKTNDGYESYVLFCGVFAFRDLKAALLANNRDGRPRSLKNPIFKDGDLEWDGVIIRQIPELSTMVEDKFTSLLTAGASSTRVEPFFLCGQQALAIAYGQMMKPTFRTETDYQFITGTGVECCYGVSKMFKKHPMGGTKLKDWGVLTGFVSAATD